MVEMSKVTFKLLSTANISSYDSRYWLTLKHMLISVYIISRQCTILVHCLLITNSNSEGSSEVNSSPFSVRMGSYSSPRLDSSNRSSGVAVAIYGTKLVSSSCDPCSGLLGVDTLREFSFYFWLSKTTKALSRLISCS